MIKTVLIFLIIILITVGIVWLIDRFFKPKWIKYIFTLCFTILTIYLIIAAKTGNHEGFRDLGNFILAMFTFCIAITSLITSIIFDIKKVK